MGRKSILRDHKVIDTGDISGDLTSSETNCEHLDRVSYFLNWSGVSPVGTITVEVSPDGSNWFELDLGSISISGNSGNHTIFITETDFKSIRLQYVSTSGTGTLNAIIHGSTEGA